MVSEGGLEVVTLVAESEREKGIFDSSLGNKDGAKAKTYKNYDSRGIRTTIQLDSDYITMLSPEVLTMPELWKRHTEVLEEKLSILENIRYWTQRSSLMLFVLSMAPPIYTLASEFSGYWSQWLLAIVSPVMGWSILRFRNRIVLWVAKRYVQRRFCGIGSISKKEEQLRHR